MEQKRTEEENGEGVVTDFVSVLTAKTGIDPGITQNGVGALLSMLQENISPRSFVTVSSIIPNAEGLLTGFLSQANSTNDGITSQPLPGGKTQTAMGLVSRFSRAGFSIDTLRVFLPAALSLLRERVSPEVMKQIEVGLPGMTSVLGGPDPRGLMDKFKDMF
ncbi:MAG: DUF2780 domain-containing protein [Ignavibacteria bacterium]|nr:DUF2780 domain-containing protein [Ignavibacteria bacterium]